MVLGPRDDIVQLYLLINNMVKVINVSLYASGKS